ncbi:hypothetical protein ACNO7O_09575 [Bisgaard Taxon 45]
MKLISGTNFHGKAFHFISTDGKWPVSEQICSLEQLKSELNKNGINVDNLRFSLCHLYDQQYGWFALN